ncbi:hypothetical protein AHAS_Ahas11G0149300 [Arachis hypogaea]
MNHLYQCDKTGTLTLNKLSVDKNLIEVFTKGVNKDHVILLAARASKTENQDAIDAAIVGMLADPKEARAGIRKVYFLPFNLVDKRTALTYIGIDQRFNEVFNKAMNFLLTSKSEDADMKLINFSLSDFIRTDERLNDISGSAYYVAPEVLYRSYSVEAEIWNQRYYGASNRAV